jgi:glycerate kinase
MAGLDRRLAKTRIEAACDVTNPLCGPAGASAVYGPQKGASPKDVAKLDAALHRFAEVAAATPACARRADPEAPGAGAAGGLGFGLVAFCGARLRRGVKIVAESVRLRERLKGCDLVITGEGRLDAQTVNGKTPAGVAKAARSLGIPCIAICGCVGDGYEAVHGIGIDAVIPASYGPYDPANPARGARERIRAAAAEAARLIFPIAEITNGTRGMRSQLECRRDG